MAGSINVFEVLQRQLPKGTLVFDHWVITCQPDRGLLSSSQFTEGHEKEACTQVQVSVYMMYFRLSNQKTPQKTCFCFVIELGMHSKVIKAIQFRKTKKEQQLKG